MRHRYSCVWSFSPLVTRKTQISAKRCRRANVRGWDNIVNFCMKSGKNESRSLLRSSCHPPSLHMGTRLSYPVVFHAISLDDIILLSCVVVARFEALVCFVHSTNLVMKCLPWCCWCGPRGVSSCNPAVHTDFCLCRRTQVTWCSDLAPPTCGGADWCFDLCMQG